MRKPLVSVILPVYNAESTLAQAVESILNQSLKDIELIIVNDGSNDNSNKILDRLTDSRISILDTENRGLARALNFGIKMAKAELIARMDADDISHVQRLEKQAKFLQNNPKVGVVSCLVDYAGDRSANKGYAIHVDDINKIMTHSQMYAKRFRDAPIAHPSAMFHKRLVAKYGGYSEDKVPEDFELWLRWFDHGVRFGKVEDTLLSWCDSPDRLSRTNEHYSEDAFHRVKAKYLRKYLSCLPKIPRVWVWGTGKLVNRQVKFLMSEGIEPSKYIDVKRHTSNKFIHYSNITTPSDDLIILSYVKDRAGKEQIGDYLSYNKFEEARHFFFMN